MTEVYGTRWIGYEHLRLSTKLGKQFLPPINVDDMAKFVLVLQKKSSDVEEVKKPYGRNCL